jgi:hypothetical protein
MKNHWQFLSDEFYRDICEKHGIKHCERDEPSILLRRLSDLGTMVTFPEDVRLSPLTVLNPEWVTHGIYRVHKHFDRKYSRCDHNPE